jgi:uncharacterized protein YjbJ (UPF0337 family)
MNNNIVKGKWDEIKGEIRKAWGGLTGDELEKTNGNMESIGGLIQQRYGLAKDDVQRKLSDIVNRHAEQTKAGLRSSNDRAENSSAKY